MRIAVFQANPTLGAVAQNAAALLAAARNLPPQTDLLVAPELYVLGYPADDLVNSPRVLAAVRDALDGLARALCGGPAVLLGAPVADARGTLNAAVWIERGQWHVVAEKMILPNTGVFDDQRVFAVGRGSGVIQIGDAYLGVMVCEDCWHPEPLEQLLSGVEAPLSHIIVINASPYESGKITARRAVIADRVQRARVPFLYVNMVGGQDELVFDGGSFQMDARGRIVAQFAQFEEGIFLADLDGEMEDVKLVSTTESEASKYEEIYHAILLGTRDYVRKNGFSKVCLGLSGGVDSALVATIAADALYEHGRAENVIAMILPSEYNSADTQTDARAQAENLGIISIETPITPAQKILESSLEKAFGADLNDIAAQNIQSRLRGLMLMALSNQTGAMLLTTGNKSEMAVGYATLYGDMNGGFNPIKDLYKTEVYKICDWRNAHSINGLAAPMLPGILSRAPSAELRPNQVDQDTLPPYELLDDILRALIEGNGAPELLAPFDPGCVVKILGWLDCNEFKRRQSAPGVRVTAKAFGRDRRFPITNKN